MLYIIFRVFRTVVLINKTIASIAIQRGNSASIFGTTGKQKNSKNCGEMTQRKDTFQVQQSNKCK